MGVRLCFGVFSVLAVVAVGAGVVVACGGDDGGGDSACTGAGCDGGASSETGTGDGSSGTDGNTPPTDPGVGDADADADSSVTINCGDGGAPGTLDETFGDGGMVVLPLAGGDARAVVVQPDGKIIVVGTTQTGSGAALTVVRLLPDGSLDATFGTGGAIERVLGGSSLLNAVALQPDGKIVAAGYATPGSQDFAVLRHLANGTPDTTFGDGGVVFTDFGSLDRANALVVLPDGRIVAAGVTAAATGDMALTRYNSDGSLDVAFGTGGKVIIDIRGTADQVRGLVRAPSGSLFAVGTSANSTTGDLDVAVVKLAANAGIDATFADGGSFVTNFGDVGSDTAQSAAVDSSGRLVVSALRGGNDFGVFRLAAGGSLDPTFGTTGAIRTDFAGRNESVAVVLIQEDGKVVVVGSSLTGTPTDSRIAVARYLADGGLDPSFGNSGQSLTPLAAGFSGIPAHGAALSACGLVVAGGWADPSLANRMGIARFKR